MSSSMIIYFSNFHEVRWQPKKSGIQGLFIVHCIAVI